MNRSLLSCRRAAFIGLWLVVAAVFVDAARAGTVYVYLVFDPATTAGAGIATIPGGGTNLAITSSRSGAGTFHV